MIVVRSIKPFWFYCICEGKKTLEIGKTSPKKEDWDKTVYLYCSKDKQSFNLIPKESQEKYRKFLGKIGASFDCKTIEKIYVPYPAYQNELPKEILEASNLTYTQMHRYAGSRCVYGWSVSNLKTFETPKELTDFSTISKEGSVHELTRAPQTWCYAKTK